MDNYIQVEDGDEPYYLPVEENTVALETVQSAFPRCCGLCFYVRKKCHVVTLQQGIFYPPNKHWKYVYEPIYDDCDDDYGDDDYHNDTEYDDDGYKYKGGAEPPEKEDINMLYDHLLRDDQSDDSDE